MAVLFVCLFFFGGGVEVKGMIKSVMFVKEHELQLVVENVAR